jgi:WD40 repeat protein/tetratricopeptide (TPR) repeat protein
MTSSYKPEDIAVYNERALTRLAWAIEASEGQFSIFLAHCNYGKSRTQLAKRLQEICSTQIRVVALPETARTLYTTLLDALGDEQPGAVMVLGLESVSDLEQVLVATNQVREEFRKKFPFPLVLWVNDEVLEKLIRLAPDFENWTTTTEFAVATETLKDDLRQRADDLFEKILDLGADLFSSGEPLYNSEYRLETQILWHDLQCRGQTIDPELQASVDFALGREDYIRNRIDTALDSFQKSLIFWQKAGLLERQGILLFHMGLCHVRLAEQYGTQGCLCWAEAKHYLQKAIDIFGQDGRQDLIAKFINSLGEVLQHLSEWEDLKSLVNQSISLQEQFNSPVRMARAYGFLAEIELEQAHWAKAEQAAHQALTTFGRAQHRKNWQESLYLLLLALAQQELDQVSEAISNLEKARELDAQNNPQVYIRTLNALRDLYFKQNDYLEAFRIKQERRSVEQQYRLRAFVGAGRIKPTPITQAGLTQAERQNAIAQEIGTLGRKKVVDDLVERIGSTQHKLTVIYGQSGVGKSSMVEAGLLPTLQYKTIGTRDVLPVSIRFYTNWSDQIACEMRTALEKLEVATSLSKENNSLEAILNQLRQNEEHNLLTVLVLDQFEEFFFVCNRGECDRFFTFFRDCLNIPFVKVLLSLREDYLHLLLRGTRRLNLDAINNSILDKQVLYYVGNLSPEEAKTIILGLTQRSRFLLEPALVDALVEELAQETGEVRPIELQVVGAQLQTENITTLVQYQEQGPKEALVQRYLEGVVEDCGPENKRAAELILYLLTDENNTRPLKTRAELEGDLEKVASGFAHEASKLDLALKIFVESGLVFLLQESPAARYQLVHDYLVTFIRHQQEPQIKELTAQLEQEKVERQRAETAKAEEKSRRLHLQQRLIWGLSGGLVISLMLTGMAVWQWRIARVAENIALDASSNLVLSPAQNLNGILGSLRAVKYLNQLPLFESQLEDHFANILRSNVYSLREQIRINSHTSPVVSVSFSPDGELVASANSDGILQLHNHDGSLIQTIQNHNASIRYISFSPDSQKLATVSDDGKIRLLDLSGNELNQWTYGKSYQGIGVRFGDFPDSEDKGTFTLQVMDVVEISPASRAGIQTNDLILEINGIPTTGLETVDQAQSIIQDEIQNKEGAAVNLKIQRVDTGTLNVSVVPENLENTEASVHKVVFSPDGKTLATAGDEGIKLWQLDGTLIQNFQGHKDTVRGISISPDGKLIASASDDQTVKIWQIDGALLETIKIHVSSVMAVSFSPTGNEIITIDANGEIGLFDRLGRRITGTAYAHSGAGEDIAFSPDGNLIASVGDDATVKLWSFDGSYINPVDTLEGHQNIVVSLSFSPDGRSIATASHDRTVRLWSTENTAARVLGSHSNASDANGTSFIDSDGPIVASVGDDDQIKLWNLDGTLRQEWSSQDAAVGVVASPGGQLLASYGNRGVNLWKPDGTLYKSLEGHDDVVWSVSFSPDGQTIASVSRDHTIRLWNLKGELLATIDDSDEQSEFGVTSVAFSPDGELIAAANGYKTKLWKRDGTLHNTFGDHRNIISKLSFSPDGKVIATAGFDNTVKLWDIDGTLLTTLQGHQGYVNDVKFSPDGEIIATASNDQTIKVWDLDGQVLGTFPGHRDGVSSVSFSPDGKTLASSSWDSRIMLWDIDTDLDRTLVKACHVIRPHLENNPNIEASDRRLCDGVERDWVAEGEELARSGDLEEAIALFQKALSQEPDLELNPEVKAQQLRALTLVQEGERLATQGQIVSASAAYKEAQQIDPELEISATSWNHLCWQGIKHEFAQDKEVSEDVVSACDKAVALDQENGQVRDSRGLARMIDGDTTGAIEDFQAFIDWWDEFRDEYKDYLTDYQLEMMTRRSQRRQRWIRMLQEGNIIPSEEIELLWREE